MHVDQVVLADNVVEHAGKVKELNVTVADDKGSRGTYKKRTRQAGVARTVVQNTPLQARGKRSLYDTEEVLMEGVKKSRRAGVEVRVEKVNNELAELPKQPYQD